MRDYVWTRIVSPAWFYGLLRSGSPWNSYFVDAQNLKQQDRALLEDAWDYGDSDSERLDLAYQSWLKGIIETEKSGLDLSDISPKESNQYIFLARHFSRIWCLFALLVRLAELNNPSTEIIGFVKSFRIKRIDPYRKTKNWGVELAEFNSKLLASEPLVSVIIPTLNRYDYLKDVLDDLELQDYKKFEVIVVDQSDEFNREFYKKFGLEINVTYQNEKAQWLARNSALKEARGDFILLFDDDSRVEPNWIRSHIKCIDFFNADISSGVSISKVGADVPKTYSYYKWGDQLDTGNAMIRRTVFETIGLFDRQFEKQRQGDGEFGLRAYLAGFKNVSNPDAARVHLKAATGGLRDLGSWDGWRPKNFFAPRPYPSVLYCTRKYFGNRAAVYQILQSVLPSITPYRFKRSKTMLMVGSVAGLFLLPLITISVLRSWIRSSAMLKEGPKIPRL